MRADSVREQKVRDVLAQAQSRRHLARVATQGALADHFHTDEASKAHTAVDGGVIMTVRILSQV